MFACSQKQDDAEEKVDALRTEIDGLKALNQEILVRMAMWDFSKVQPVVRTYSYSISTQNQGIGDPSQASQPSEPNNRNSLDNSEPSVVALRKDARGFAFEELLMNSRAYRSAAHNNSDVFSVSTSAGRTATWSMLSGLSLSEMSNIAILAIPVYQSDLHDKEAYDFEPAQTDNFSEVVNQDLPSPEAATKARMSSKVKGWLKKSLDAKPKPELETQLTPAKIFGVALTEGIRYANVAISLSNTEGELFVYGYIPIIVAKVGVFVKEKGD